VRVKRRHPLRWILILHIQSRDSDMTSDSGIASKVALSVSSGMASELPTTHPEQIHAVSEGTDCWVVAAASTLSRVRVTTVMSSSWPNCMTASAIAFADWLLMAWVRSKP
jgi:hypothetical protein